VGGQRASRGHKKVEAAKRWEAGGWVETKKGWEARGQVKAAKGWEAIKTEVQYFQTALFLPLP